MMDRLISLIFSFYREEPCLQQMLLPLQACTMTRRKGIDCLDIKHMEEVISLITFIQRPLAEMSLAKELIVCVPGLKKKSFLIQLSSQGDVFAHGDTSLP